MPIHFDDLKDKEKLDLYADLRHLSQEDFRSLGAADIAYVRPVKKGNSMRFEVRAADGTILTTLNNYAGAEAAITSNDMHAITLQ